MSRRRQKVSASEFKNTVPRYVKMSRLAMLAILIAIVPSVLIVCMSSSK
jgi:hypothetical protein